MSNTNNNRVTNTDVIIDNDSVHVLQNHVDSIMIADNSISIYSYNIKSYRGNHD